MQARSTQEVFESHLDLRKQGRVEEDIALNYDEHVVQLTGSSGVRRGHDGVRDGAKELQQALPDSEFEYASQWVEGEVALLVWNARSSAGHVTGAADTFVIRNGRIVVQTIQYRVEPG